MRKITIVTIVFLFLLMLIPHLKADDMIPNAGLISDFTKSDHPSCITGNKLCFSKENVKAEMEEASRNEVDDELYNLAEIVFEKAKGETLTPLAMDKAEFENEGDLYL